jgi:putative acetyltransferase
MSSVAALPGDKQVSLPIVRTENVSDHTAIHHVETAAFDRPDEADLVDRLREANALLLSLVAEQAGEIVGHVAFSPVKVTADDETYTAVGLGPVAVLPSMQKQGIGGMLIREGLKQLREAGHELVFLIGHPAYYPRFGFRPAVQLGFGSDYITEGEPNDHFMVIALVDGAFDDRAGQVRYHPDFEDV